MRNDNDYVQTIEYDPSGNRHRELKVVLGPTSRDNKIVFYVHNDIWSDCSASLDLEFLKSLSSYGFTIIAPSLCDGSKGGLGGLMDDIGYALKWLKDSLDELGNHPKSFAFLANGFGAQLALLAYAANYSPQFRSILNFPNLELSIRGAALVSPITDLKEVAAINETDPNMISFRQKILAQAYGPNYQTSVLYQKTASSYDYCRTLAALKARIHILNFSNDLFMPSTTKFYDNLKLNGGYPTGKLIENSSISREEFFSNPVSEDGLDILKTLSESLENLYNC